MKKRIFLFLALAVLIEVGVFAQTHFVSAEASFLGGGSRYEYVITPYFTVGGYAYYNYLPTPFMDKYDSENHWIAGTSIAGRWYPAGRRFFAELGLGYVFFENQRTEEGGYHYSWNGYTYTPYKDNDHPESDHFSGFSIAPGFGWTIDIGRAGGLFISPSVKAPFIISSESKDIGLGQGVYPSVVVSFGVGYAFEKR
ncbi:hypothetical protein TREPR_3497 [Treponema primitia ZAS-2]|uniref:Outer membrane protein beta-barrel domain-containing protein n=1 Tax=Treponema primitia (strain ATCC BAA-887 / DSM 12427 / ZAS-2) TaxID=545694 RepID=F5YIX6_TREPZ|nr:hypothetical protein [Treponema primitia]AEF85921.1 hypothetical protein TREPR_3497 [Treponema primitia ZAS-2]